MGPEQRLAFSEGRAGKILPQGLSVLRTSLRQFLSRLLGGKSPQFGQGRIAVDHESITEKLFLRSPPTRFGEVYRSALAQDESGCTVYLHANVIGNRDRTGRPRVESLLTKGLDGKTRRFTSKIYILASGIENARLLLLSNRVRPNGLGNDHDNVGRYFMAHTTLRTGRALLSIPDETIKLYKTRGSRTSAAKIFP